MLEPDGPPVGAVVLLHGLTDSPYSLRHIAAALPRPRLRRRRHPAAGARHRAGGADRRRMGGLGGRDPARGARGAPARSARQAAAHRRLLQRRRAGDASTRSMRIEDPQLARPDRLVLISPMIGITAFARFAGVAGLPALFPAFAKAAWLGVVPEFNPVQVQLVPGQRRAPVLPADRARCRPRSPAQARDGKLDGLPPILTFQSVVDFTVSTRAIITALYARLPANGSELVLFDLNRTPSSARCCAPAPTSSSTGVLPPPPRDFRARSSHQCPATARPVRRAASPRPARPTEQVARRSAWPSRLGVFSLSHVALPFPLERRASTACSPTPATISASISARSPPRGERGALIVSLEFAAADVVQPVLPLHARKNCRRIDAGP